MTGRTALRCPGRLRLAGLVLAFALAACGGGDSEREELMALVEGGQWEQVRARSAELRQSGLVEPWLDYADGLAALQAGDEEEARRLLAGAVSLDPAMGGDVAKAWADAARVDYEAGWRERATARMTEAILAEPSTDPGEMLPAVANYLYRHRKDYEAAWPLYERLVRERPEPASRHPEWVYRWGHLHETRGQLDEARSIYEGFFEEFPNDKAQGRYAHWRYTKVLLEQARRAREAGDDEAALALLELALEDGWHIDQQQRAEFMIGRIREAQGRVEEAREHYATAVEYGEIVETEVIDEARERLEALDAQQNR